MTLTSYPKVWQLGHRQAAGIFYPPGPVFVQEKLDGSQISFGLVEGNLCIRSKGVNQDLANPDKMFNQAIEQITMREDQLNSNYIYRGEYLNKPKHNAVNYDRVPAGNISVFDIETRDTQQFLHPQEVFDEALRIGWEASWLMHTSSAPLSAEWLHDILDNVSKLGGSKVEGVVLKNYNSLTGFGHPVFAKYVSEEFKEMHSKQWKMQNKKDFIVALGEKYYSEARYEKALIHMEERSALKHEPSDISAIFKEVAYDFEEEWASEVKEDLWNHFRKHILKAVQHNIPQWYKDKLAANVLEAE